jgi:CheY-like chemotaxis protein
VHGEAETDRTGSPARRLLVISSALVASFLASTFYAQWAARAIDGKAISIVTEIAPAVTNLSAMRTHAHRLAVAVRQSVWHAEGTTADEGLLTRMRVDLDETFGPHGNLAGVPGTRRLYEDLRQQRRELLGDVEKVLSAAHGGRRSEAEWLMDARLGPCLEKFDEAVRSLIEAGSQEESLRALEIPALRRHVEHTAYGLNALTAFLGFAAMMLAARSSRQQMGLLHEKERQLRDALETSRLEAERTRILQEVTAALSEAPTPEDVGHVVLARAVPALGGSGGTLLRLSDDGERLQPVAGDQGAEDPPSAEISLHADLPAAEVARTGGPLFLEHAGELGARFPSVAAPMARAGVQALAVLPLVSQGKLLGVLCASFGEPCPFDQDERRLMLTMANLCAQALERARLYGETERASRAKDEFLAMLGHELRNPLAPMATALQLMRLRRESGESRERAVIERQLQHLARLVDDLLDVSRITRGKIELRRRPLELGTVLTRALEVAAPLFEQQRHELALSVPRNGLVVNADEPRLTQVIANLLTNAAKYTPPEGKVEVSAFAEGEDVVLTVRDSGIGIDRELLPRVFELFVQGPRSIARSDGGLGLGLALVRSLVTLHGGAVHATSAGPGLGSTFTIRLPAARPETLVGEPEPEERPAPGHQLSRRLLVVDDNRDAADALAEALREVGYEVDVAYDGPRALELAQQLAVDVALLDIGLPVMDGYELAQRLRAISPLTRLIAVTGYGQQHDRARALQAGFDRHFVKPVDLGELLQGIEAHGAPAGDVATVH